MIPFMPRTIPESRLQDLLETATRVFIEQGYRRTQIADVAAALGVAKGTVYLYVESKEALFYAALRYADRKAPLASEVDLPLGADDIGAVLGELRATLADQAIPPALARALARTCVVDARSELEEIVRELYSLSYRHRTVIKLVDRCGRDHPAFAKIFYGKGRFAQLDALARYLDMRIRAGRFPAVRDVAVAARFIIETIAIWAVHIHWDPAPQPIDPEAAEETVVQLVVRALTGAAQ
jgi:AcrR family transcriptional regulator